MNVDKNLIPITDYNGKKAVNARALHQFLESKREFATWMKDRIKKYGLTENQDYVVFDEFVNNSKGGRPLTEYALTLDCAKELAMVEGLKTYINIFFFVGSKIKYMFATAYHIHTSLGRTIQKKQFIQDKGNAPIGGGMETTHNSTPCVCVISTPTGAFLFLLTLNFKCYAYHI